MTSSIRLFLRSVRFALRGLGIVLAHEQNFRIQIAATVVAFALAAWVRVRPWELIAIVLAAVIVLVLECINSAVERLLDLVQPRLHGYVREIKDTMAGAVLVASVGAAAIVLAIIIPRFL